MSGSVAAPCAGAAIPSWGSTGNWGQDTCQAGTDEASAIVVTAGPGLAAADREGLGVAGAGMASPGGSVVNLQELRTGKGVWEQGLVEPGQGGASGMEKVQGQTLAPGHQVLWVRRARRVLDER